jgi:predicted  nucleic acid-binding Zn-ribbon protein
MKCPKCGFNSFEYYDSCKKCSGDLIAFKAIHSVTSLVLPLEAKEKLVEEYRSAEHDTEQTADAVESHDDIFSFDLPGESFASADRNDDPFNFDEPAPDATLVPAQKPDDDVFAELLESTSHADESSFGTSTISSSAPEAKPAESSSTAGEYDLDSFSWDESPAGTVVTDSTVASDATAAPDDFDSLFGDMKEPGSK